MLVSAKEMLDKAKAGHYAVGQFNINNLEWTKSVLLTAEELRSPVILGVSEGAGKYMTGFGTVAAMVKAMHDELGITVPVALHLDHGTKDAINVSKQDSHPSCSTVLITQSMRTLRKPKSSYPLPMQWECPSRQKLVLSVVRKTEL